MDETAKTLTVPHFNNLTVHMNKCIDFLSPAEVLIGCVWCIICNLHCKSAVGRSKLSWSLMLG